MKHRHELMTILVCLSALAGFIANAEAQSAASSDSYECDGFLLSKNYEQAFIYCGKAAEGNVASAQFGLASIYHEGLGRTQDTQGHSKPQSS